MNVSALHLPPLDGDTVDIPPIVQQRLSAATHAIVARGWYMTASHQTVTIAQAQARTKATTRRVPADSAVLPRRCFAQTVTMVHQQTALTVGQAWYRRGYRVAMVNTTPLWLCHPATVVARIPDTTLLLASGIADCVVGSGLYRQRTDQDDALVATPQLPVFRTDVGDLLERVWYVDVLTTQFDAMNDHGLYQQITPTKFQRWLTQVVQTASGLGANVLVIHISVSSDIELLAQLFARTLAVIHPCGLAVIDFAIPYTNPAQSKISPFAGQFNGRTYHH